MNKTIKGFAGAQTNNPKMGTLCWQWLDDKGRMHTIEIPNSYYVPECEQRLLSPQHWAQTRSASDRATTRCITLVLNVYLRWTKGDESYELTLPLNKRDPMWGSYILTLATTNMIFLPGCQYQDHRWQGPYSRSGTSHP